MHSWNKRPPVGSGTRHGVAARYIDRLRQHGHVCFSLSELLRETGLSTIAARRQLAVLGPRVVRVAPRQGFFLIVDPEHRPNGAPPASWWLDAWFQWLERPYYLALQSAAAEYGSAAQALQVTQIITDRPRRDIVLGRIRVRFFVKATVTATPTGPQPNAFAPLAVSTPEATVVDLVRYAPRIGGIEGVAETLRPLLSRLNAARLADLLGNESEVPTLQRLGFLLDVMGYSQLATAVHGRLPGTVRRVLLNIGAGPVSGREDATDPRWSVVVNAYVGSIS